MDTQEGQPPKGRDGLRLIKVPYNGPNVKGDFSPLTCSVSEREGFQLLPRYHERNVLNPIFKLAYDLCGNPVVVDQIH